MTSPSEKEAEEALSEIEQREAEIAALRQIIIADVGDSPALEAFDRLVRRAHRAAPAHLLNPPAAVEVAAPLPSTSEARDPEVVKAFARLKRGIIMRGAQPEPQRLDPRWDERYLQDCLAVERAIKAAAMAEAQERAASSTLAVEQTCVNVRFRLPNMKLGRICDTHPNGCESPRFA